ncbi:NADH dehydrogenase [Pseudomonas putida]|nr:NADH dehydrogenase [Pseudomonas putida]
MNSTLIQTDRFALSETERSAIEHELHHYEDPRAASIEALKIVQKERDRQPVGRHIIRVCDSMVCYIGGHESVVSEIQSKLGIGLGQTTADGRFTLLPVCCLGNCDKAPALMIDDDTFGDVQPAGVAQLLEGYV